MDRHFLSAGHGAFYYERFMYNACSYIVIYDCGSIDEKHIKLVINKFIANLNDNDIIIAVFISHLHADHINGLIYLLNILKSRVKKIYYPFMTDKEKIISLFDLILNNKYDKNNNFEFIKKLHINFNETIKVISPETETIEIKKTESTSDDAKKNTIYLSNMLDHDIYEYYHWVFIPFNIESRELQKKHDSILSDINSFCADEVKKIENVLSIDVKILEKISGKYKDEKMMDKLNIFSMTLYSGPKFLYYSYNMPKFTPMCSQPIRRCHNYLFNTCCLRNKRHKFNYLCMENKVAALYTGDYDARNYGEKLVQYYGEYWGNIGTMQIPHHGSIQNIDYSSKITNNIFNLIISYNSKDKYHPSSCLLTQIYHDNELHDLYLVDEDPKHEAEFFISY